MDNPGLKLTWFNVESVPNNYILSPEERPGDLPIPICDSIPIIDLQTTNDANLQKILKAGQEFGFFQVINHGVAEEVIGDTMRVYEEYFEMGEEEKRSGGGGGCGGKKGAWIYSSSADLVKDGISYWRENIKHPCHPLEQRLQRWPPLPPTYREVVAKYLVEVKKLGLRILDMIGIVLGLGSGYFEEISEIQLLSANKYPPCPDPTLTMGLPAHRDPSLITLLFQGQVCGLQVLDHHGQWIGVPAITNAFVINIGNQLEIISNGKMRSAEHRAVTNSKEMRISIAAFMNPSPDYIVGPAKSLINEENPPLYESFLYRDFVLESKPYGPFTELVLGQIDT